MRKRRGTTLVEMALALSLTALVLGVLAVLYGFTMGRLAHATANFGATNDASLAANAIGQTIRDAYSCTTVTSNGKTGLRCTMPANATDRDGDGKQDTYLISSVSRRGLERTVAGRRVWYYLGDSTGAFGTTGTILWRAERTDDSNPTASDVDRAFAYVNTTQPRYPLISSLTFSVDSTALTVTFTISASALTRAVRSAPAGEATNQSYSHTETRTAFWRNWRK